jgi:hypothetical protein
MHEWVRDIISRNRGSRTGILEDSDLYVLVRTIPVEGLRRRTLQRVEKSYIPVQTDGSILPFPNSKCSSGRIENDKQETRS